MINTLLFIWAFVILLGLSAALALIWAIGTGQLRDLNRGATMIFDDDEPIGRPTDSFPNSEKS